MPQQRIKKEPKWIEVYGSGIATINFGPVQLMCYRDPSTGEYRYKVGSYVHDKKFANLEIAKRAGMRFIIKLGRHMVDSVRALPDYDKEKVEGKKRIKNEDGLDDWHLSIVNQGKKE
jgi:hypothetical protein